ncbi:murein L,D-transpeptidase catalytic domain-containing protein [Hymenobacter sp. IS2118]|uniref:murein L,D-transpeptidase catalytic domain-containing protein n=1 Tax=Hymenobacter sp. IS2118 TaxID=1505605 RepID=UPI0009DCFA85
MYRLYGLEPSTRNVRRRAVVLHSWVGVPAEPGAGHPIQSEGCPTLNPEVLDAVAEVIAGSPKPLLLRLN